MSTVFLVMVLGFATFICIGLPLLYLRFYVRRLQTMAPKRRRVSLGIHVALGAFLAYFIYISFYPDDSFFEAEFTKITRLPFPSTGKIVFKDASYPTVHGDYCAAALIELSWEEYQELVSSIAPHAGSDGRMGSSELNNLKKYTGGISMAAETWWNTDEGYGYWGAVRGKPWIIIHFCSS